MTQIIYDIASKPITITISELVEISEKYGFIFWDSVTGGKQPIIEEVDTTIIGFREVNVIDVSTDEGEKTLNEINPKP